MSPVNDNLLSSERIRFVAFVLLIMMTGCFPVRRSVSPAVMSDRLLNMLLQNQLPLGTPESPLRAEVQRCGQWLRIQLENDPAATFRLEPEDNRIVSANSGNSRILVPELSELLDRLNSFFLLNSAVPRSMFTPGAIRRLLLHSASRAAIMELIRLDQQEKTSEIGGVVTVQQDAGFLEFHVIESENARWVRRLQNIDSPAVFARELQSMLPSIPFLRVRAERTLDVLLSPEKHSDNDKVQDAIDSFLDLLQYHSQYSYILDQGTQYAAIAEAGIHGIYMGVFHVHPPGNPPSLEDKAGSILRKNFVIVPGDGDVEVHYLDFTADLAGTPEIIRFSVTE
jgi:hypothetical protein